MSTDNCSAYRIDGRLERCANGFPTNAGCVGIEGAVPWCCNETLCARLWPDTGKPPFPIVPIYHPDK